MSRSRDNFAQPNLPHFPTCTVVEWLPVRCSTRPATAQILLDTWTYQQAHEGLRLNGFGDGAQHRRWSSARCAAGRNGVVAVLTDW